MKKIILLVFMLLLPVLSINTVVKSNTDGLNIVTTTSIIANVVNNIAGDKIIISSLIGNGVDPHDFQPTSETSQILQEADIIFYSGGGVEEGLKDTLSSLTMDGKAFSLFDSLPESLLIKNSLVSEEEVYDPHFWNDPTLMVYAINMITEQIGLIDESNNNTYFSNAENYKNSLIDLDVSISDKVNELNNSSKFLVTQHNAFQYWTRRYGFQSNSLTGMSTNDETGISEIESLAKYLKDNKVEVIFLESTVPDDRAQAVIDASNAIGWKVVNGGVLYSGSLGDGEASSYIGMLTENTNTIVNAIKNPPTSEEVPVIGFWLGLLISMTIIRRRKKNE